MDALIIFIVVTFIFSLIFLWVMRIKREEEVEVDIDRFKEIWEDRANQTIDNSGGVAPELFPDKVIETVQCRGCSAPKKEGSYCEYCGN